VRDFDYIAYSAERMVVAWSMRGWPWADVNTPVEMRLVTWEINALS